MMIPAAIHRPGCRTGIALISSGLTAAATSVTARRQLIAPLIFGFEIAPCWIPHFARIDL